MDSTKEAGIAEDTVSLLTRVETALIALELAIISGWVIYLTIRYAVPRHDGLAIVIGVLYSAAVALGSYLLARIAKRG